MIRFADAGRPDSAGCEPWLDDKLQLTALRVVCITTR